MGIISMAQQARPKLMGQMLCRRERPRSCMLPVGWESADGRLVCAAIGGSVRSIRRFKDHMGCEPESEKTRGGKHAQCTGYLLRGDGEI
jgi:hypothetical protein